MKHPEALLLPLLMFADYLLTIAGAIWKDRGYHRHFKLDSYELNPVWQNDVARRRWFNEKEPAGRCRGKHQPAGVRVRFVGRGCLSFRP